MQTKPALYKSSLDKKEKIANAVVLGWLGYFSPKYGRVGSFEERFFRLVAGSNFIRTAGVFGVETGTGVTLGANGAFLLLLEEEELVVVAVAADVGGGIG